MINLIETRLNIDVIVKIEVISDVYCLPRFVFDLGSKELKG